MLPLHRAWSLLVVVVRDHLDLNHAVLARRTTERRAAKGPTGLRPRGAKKHVAARALLAREGGTTAEALALLPLQRLRWGTALGTRAGDQIGFQVPGDEGAKEEWNERNE